MFRCFILCYSLCNYYKYILLAFNIVIAAGPFTTSDSLDMDPLNDLLRIVDTEKPDILVLVRSHVLLDLFNMLV